MEIEPYSIIISIVMLSFFFVPIIYDKMSKSSGTRKMRSQLFAAAKELNLTLSEWDVWHDAYAIGLDPASRKVLYLHLNQVADQREVLDLSGIQTCRVKKAEHSVKKSDKRLDAIDGIELRVLFTDEKLPELRLSFYRNEKGRAVQNELMLADKWANIIRRNVTSGERIMALAS